MKTFIEKFKKRLIGAAATIAIGGGSLVFTCTADGCNVQYVRPTDVNGEVAPVDINGAKPKGKF